MTRDARFKFDSGVISLNHSQSFATHSNQWYCSIFQPETTDDLKIAIFECVFKVGKCHGPKHSRLTLIGKLQLIKLFTIPKIMCKASLIHTSNDLKQKRNCLISFGKKR